MPLRNMLGIGCRFLGLVCLVMAFESTPAVLGSLFFQDLATIPFRIVALETASAIVALALMIAVGWHLLKGGRIVHRLEFGGEEETPPKKAQDLFLVLMRVYGVWLIASGLGSGVSNLGVLARGLWRDTAGVVLVSIVCWCGIVAGLGLYLVMGGGLVRRIAFGRPGQNVCEGATSGR